MDSSLAGNPFLWAFLAGASFGLALFSLLRECRRGSRIVPFMVLLSLTVAFAACGAVFAGKRILDVTLAWFSGISAILVLAAFRFPRAAGIPLAAIALAAAGIIAVFAADFSPIPADGFVARMEAAPSAAAQGAAKAAAGNPPSPVLVEISRPGIPAFSVTLPDGTIEPVAQVVEFSDAYFFMRAHGLYRWTGYRTGGMFVKLKVQSFVSGLFWGYEAADPHVLPGIAFRTVSVRGAGFQFLRSYELTMGADGALSLTERR
jgi:hypothetical protein